MKRLTRFLACGFFGACAFAFACNRTAPQAGNVGATPGSSDASLASAAPSALARSDAELRAALKIARDPEVDELWTRAAAKESEADDLARLARREGSAGLMERGADPAYRELAVRALAHTEGFGSVAWLAEVALGAGEAESQSALASIADLAAQPRRATDPEDALELHAGCERLLGFAKDVGRAKKARIEAVRALRMLADRGCVRIQDIPADLDAH